MKELTPGQKIAQTNREKHGADFYFKLGQLGGSTRTPNTKKKGFASMDKDRLRAISVQGGRISRRSK